ncbi:hypothetical protein BJ508DRAFT_419236 [Ascobolus immersus RN42]|uniref:Uncharacterized protein n=1 Tax=Ascobolus immersus RN42 TaxID=1160509 RepID=A0A3N4HK06_ASCIM|nr:hypothetical protein BJ508DRAFT_419236 [Ascobolus immersus RN42]
MSSLGRFNQVLQRRQNPEPEIFFIIPSIDLSDDPNHMCLGKMYPKWIHDYVLDADISGIGVTISFFLSAFGTFLFVMYGFYRGLLFTPGPQHRSDRLAFKWIRFLIDGLIGLMPRWIVQYLIRPKPLSTGEDLEREKDEFNSAVQVLGDQQLVIGLAYLFGGLSSPCEMSNYSLRNLSAIAWLSSVVHITALIAIGRSTTHSRTSQGNIFRLVLTSIMILLTFVYTALLTFVSCFGDGAWVDKAVFASVITAFQMLQNFPTYLWSWLYLEFIFFIAFGLWLCTFYAAKLRSSIWPERTGALRLSEHVFRFMARQYGLSLPVGFDYSAYQQVRRLSEWIWMQDKMRSRQGTKSQNEDDQRPLARATWLQVLWISVPPEKGRHSVSRELLLLIFFLMQGTTRFLVVWISFTWEKSNWGQLEWGTGQIIPIVMLVSSFMTWMSLGTTHGKASMNEDNTTSHLPREPLPPHRPWVFRGDTEITLTNEPCAVEYSESEPLDKGCPTFPDSHPSHYLTPSEYYELPQQVRLVKLKLIGKLVASSLLSGVQLLNGVGFSGIAGLVVLSFGLAGFLVIASKTVFRFFRDVHKDRVILREKKKEMLEAEARGCEVDHDDHGRILLSGNAFSDAQESGSTTKGRMAAGQVSAQHEKKMLAEVEAVRERIRYRQQQLREDQELLWLVEVEASRRLDLRKELRILDSAKEWENCAERCPTSDADSPPGKEERRKGNEVSKPADSTKRVERIDA